MFSCCAWTVFLKQTYNWWPNLGSNLSEMTECCCYFVYKPSKSIKKHQFMCSWEQFVTLHVTQVFFLYFGLAAIVAFTSSCGIWCCAWVYRSNWHILHEYWDSLKKNEATNLNEQVIGLFLHLSGWIFITGWLQPLTFPTTLHHKEQTLQFERFQHISSENTPQSFLS